MHHIYSLVDKNSHRDIRWRKWKQPSKFLVEFLYRKFHTKIWFVAVCWFTQQTAEKQIEIHWNLGFSNCAPIVNRVSFYFGFSVIVIRSYFSSENENICVNIHIYLGICIEFRIHQIFRKPDKLWQQQRALDFAHLLLFELLRKYQINRFRSFIIIIINIIISCRQNVFYFALLCEIYPLNVIIHRLFVWKTCRKKIKSHEFHRIYRSKIKNSHEMRRDCVWLNLENQSNIVRCEALTIKRDTVDQPSVCCDWHVWRRNHIKRNFISLVDVPLNRRWFVIVIKCKSSSNAWHFNIYIIQSSIWSIWCSSRFDMQINIQN